MLGGKITSPELNLDPGPCSGNASEFLKISKGSWSLEKVPAVSFCHCAYGLAPSCLGLVSQVIFSWVWRAVQIKSSSSGGGGGWKRVMGHMKESSQTGLPKCPPALHDPRARGPVTVVCQLNLVGCEAIIRHLVLPVKCIWDEKTREDKS